MAKAVLLREKINFCTVYSTFFNSKERKDFDKNKKELAL